MAAQENRDLREALDYIDQPRLADYHRINTRVITQLSPQSGERLLIAAGSDSGIRKHAPVLASGTLVGEVTEVTPGTALVTLLTDESSAVTAFTIRTGATGIVESGEGGSLVLDNLPKDKDVTRGDLVATAGSGVERLPSLFPRGIPIATVTSASQTDTEPFKRIQLASDGRPLQPRRRHGARPVTLDVLKVTALVFVAVVLQSSIVTSIEIAGATPDLAARHPRGDRAPARRDLGRGGRVRGRIAARHGDPRASRRDVPAAHGRGLLDRALRGDHRPRPLARTAALRRRRHGAVRRRRARAARHARRPASTRAPCSVPHSFRGSCST